MLWREPPFLEVRLEICGYEKRSTGAGGDTTSARPVKKEINIEVKIVFTYGTQCSSALSIKKINVDSEILLHS